MKAKTLALVGAGTLMLAGAANADIVGASFDVIDSGGATDLTIRVYVNTDSADTQVVGVAGGAINAVGGTFFNSSFDAGNTPNDTEYLDSGLPGALFDSWITVGYDNSDNAAAGVLLIGSPFPNIEGSSFDLSAQDPPASWVVLPTVGDPPVTNPDTLGEFDAESGTWRVLIGQFSVVADGRGSGGSVSMNGTFGAIDGDANQVEVSFDTIPAPGALALLGLAGLAGSRRRRK